MNQKPKIKIPYIPWLYAVAAILFGAACVGMSRVHYSGSVWGTVEENYLLPLDWTAAGIFLAGVSAALAALLFFDWIFEKCIRIEQTYHWKKRRFVLICGAVIFAAWLPYYLTYYPGGIYSDTFASIYMAIGDTPLNNKHPIIYTLLLKAFIAFGESIGKDLNWTLGLFFAVQMVVMGGAVISMGCWLLKHGIQRSIIILSMLYLIFFPLVPLNTISIWKDALFTLAVLWYSFALIDLYLDRKKSVVNYKLAVKWAVLSVFVVLTRNNGI